MFITYILKSRLRESEKEGRERIETGRKRVREEREHRIDHSIFRFVSMSCMKYAVNITT